MRREMFVFFFFNDTATTEIYTLSLHDALPILCACFASIISGFRISLRISNKNNPFRSPYDKTLLELLIYL